MALRKCNQKQCSHWHENTCQPCESCKAEPLVISTTCANCLRCENVPAQLRFGDPNLSEEDIKLQQEMAEMHQAMVEAMIIQAMEIDQKCKGQTVEVIIEK